MTERCHCTTLRQAASYSTAMYDAALAPAGIKVTMFRLLRRIDAADGASITELADLLGLDRSTLGRNLRVLERMGLVDGRSGEDARARRIVLTAEGRATLAAAIPLWQSAQDAFARELGSDAIAVLAHLADLAIASPVPAHQTGSRT